MNEVEISIVIVNYNAKQLLLTCIQTVFDHCGNLSIELIVVDNASKDGSVEALKRQFPKVKIIENTENAGFPAANNQAFAVVQGAYIMMLNPDTEFLEDSLNVMLSYLKSNQDVSLVGPRLLNTDGSRQLSVWRFPRIRYILAEMFYLNMLTPGRFYLKTDLEKPTEVESMSGAVMFFNKKLIDKVGLLDTYLFWIEDVDFCYRIKERGGKVVYLPQTKVKHHIGGSAKKDYTISLSIQIFNKIKFYKVHYSTFKTAIVVFLGFFNACLRFTVFGILSPLGRVYYLKSKAYLYTIPRVFNPPANI